jgi:hypothetical protein
MKKCIECGLEASKKAYIASQCENCYSKFKQAIRIMRLQFSSKHGNWVCGKCGRGHCNKKSFCWECGASKDQASWADGHDRILDSSPS